MSNCLAPHMVYKFNDRLTLSVFVQNFDTQLLNKRVPVMVAITFVQVVSQGAPGGCAGKIQTCLV